MKHDERASTDLIRPIDLINSTPKQFLYFLVVCSRVRCFHCILEVDQWWLCMLHTTACSATALQLLVTATEYPHLQDSVF